MPTVTMCRRISGKRNGRDWPNPGETIEVSEDEARTLDRLGLADSGVPEPAPADEATEPAEPDEPNQEEPAEADALDSMKLSELRELAADRGLSTSGNKATLLDRLRGE